VSDIFDSLLCFRCKDITAHHVLANNLRECSQCFTIRPASPYLYGVTP
jgi:hypothetical protein